MEAQPFNLSIPLLLILHLHLLLLLLLHQVPTVQSTDNLRAEESATAAYIRSSCAPTLYPDVCYNSLSCYAGAVRNDPGRLAPVAISVSLSKVRQVATYLSKANYGSEPRVAATLRDCCSNFDDGMDMISDSLNQMRGIDSSSQESFRVKMSNIQTWMSASLTDQVTCMEGFKDVPDGPVKLEVNSRVTSVKQVTSNALALVNSYVNQIAA